MWHPRALPHAGLPVADDSKAHLSAAVSSGVGMHGELGVVIRMAGAAWSALCHGPTVLASHRPDCAPAEVQWQRGCVLSTRRPRWNPRQKTLTLDFQGRCSLASAKNFQLEAEGDAGRVVLLFGKVEKDRFVLDHSHPLGTVQASARDLSRGPGGRRFAFVAMPADLDQTLEEMIETTWEPKGKGKKGKGKDFSRENGYGYDGKGWGKAKGNGQAKGRGFGQASGQKLDMSLDELVDDGTSAGKSKGKGPKGAKGSWNTWDSNGHGYSGYSSNYSNYDASWGKSYGKSWGKSRPKGEFFDKGKSWGKGKDGASTLASPYWMEHDDWRMDEEEGKGGKGKGGKGKDTYDAYDYDGYNARYEDKGWGKGKGEGVWARSLRDTDMREDRGYGSYAVGRPGMWSRIDEERSDRRGDRNERDADRLRRGGESRPRPSGLRLERNRLQERASERERDLREAPRKRPREEDRDGPPPASAARTRARVTAPSAPKRIKVTNIPKELKAADVREAFEAETGKITLCELSRGTCRITFARAKDAQQAVETFDRGELNGKVISVILED
ncbi:Tubby-like F-box protein 2 [Symbiodinium microadriaticum]|uniref:Tubby-like F-box protein 2 n=1 Tax=Symbiodinium microadriaticum TaxID=2951 RepID=A0A1Q9C0F6_SYMMI|nr:Tubby-like F-box protein 2 [Symbiodinium microadriaticum]